MTWTSAPAMRKSLRQCMGAPLGERIIVRPFPPTEESTSGIIIPDLAKQRPFAGRILAAGDQACDRLWDVGVDKGDEIWWAKFGGVIEVWDHITKDGDSACTHSWVFAGTPQDRTFVHRCSLCGAEKTQEPMIVMSSEDILVDVDLQERIETGKVRRYRGATDDGRTRYMFERLYTTQDDWRDSWAY